MKGGVVSRHKGYAERKVVAIYKRDVVERLLAIGTTGKKELGKCYRSVALLLVSYSILLHKMFRREMGRGTCSYNAT